MDQSHHGYEADFLTTFFFYKITNQSNKASSTTNITIRTSHISWQVIRQLEFCLSFLVTSADLPSTTTYVGQPRNKLCGVPFFILTFDGESIFIYGFSVDLGSRSPSYGSGEYVLLQIPTKEMVFHQHILHVLLHIVRVLERKK